MFRSGVKVRAWVAQSRRWPDERGCGSTRAENRHAARARGGHKYGRVDGVSDERG
ncbi:hypothetical protein C8T65DRAFT_635458 [Cerioporus squamosus]|nr:hypothetical protein C8T65DRAFT_635458 [Cerioporus squamosus]